MRVVRGPDWERGNKDSGEETVVACARADGADNARHDVATVQWDIGEGRHLYCCGCVVPRASLVSYPDPL